MNEMMTTLSGTFAKASLTQWLIFLPLFLGVYFLPSLLALAFNRKHLKLILIANIPAGFSFIAWGALIVWAVTGKMMEKSSQKKALFNQGFFMFGRFVLFTAADGTIRPKSGWQPH